MDDPELDRIRQQRLAQLQAQRGVCIYIIGYNYFYGALQYRWLFSVIFQGTGDSNHAKAQEERMQAMEEAKHSILSQALSQDARARRKLVTLKY